METNQTTVRTGRILVQGTTKAKETKASRQLRKWGPNQVDVKRARKLGCGFPRRPNLLVQRLVHFDCDRTTAADLAMWRLRPQKISQSDILLGFPFHFYVYLATTPNRRPVRVKPPVCESGEPRLCSITSFLSITIDEHEE